MGKLREKLSDSNRIIVKVGTSTLLHENGMVNLQRIDRLSMVLSDLCNMGKEITLVTSGAIGVGTGKLNLKKKPKSIRYKQAVASVGQCELMHIYSKFFAEYGHVVGQILLTQVDVRNSYARNNVVNTFETLLKMGIVPIVNENDSVSVEEIKIGQYDVFSENDTLSAIVASLIKADLLIILTDIDGFFDSDPKVNSHSRLISLIEEITPETKLLLRQELMWYLPMGLVLRLSMI